MAAPKRFAITAQSNYSALDNLIVGMYTDIACHLKIRVTDQEPVRDLRWIFRRGLPMKCLPFWTFIGLYHIEQEEPGDTRSHTFIIPNLVFCNWRWFQPWGTVAGKDAVSAGPIFKAHFPVIRGMFWEPWNADFTTNNPWQNLYPQYTTVDVHHGLLDLIVNRTPPYGWAQAIKCDLLHLLEPGYYPPVKGCFLIHEATYTPPPGLTNESALQLWISPPPSFPSFLFYYSATPGTLPLPRYNRWGGQWYVGLGPNTQDIEERVIEWAKAVGQSQNPDHYHVEAIGTWSYTTLPPSKSFLQQAHCGLYWFQK